MLNPFDLFLVKFLPTNLPQKLLLVNLKQFSDITDVYDSTTAAPKEISRVLEIRSCYQVT